MINSLGIYINPAQTATGMCALDLVLILSAVSQSLRLSAAELTEQGANLDLPL
jgi:hypothetical protein